MGSGTRPQAAVLLAFFLLVRASPLAQTNGQPELEIRVLDIQRESSETSDLIRIRAEAVNRSSRSLYLEVCCGWKDVPDRFHNPSVEQLSSTGEWIFVGGAYQDIPGFLRELKPGAQFQSEVFVVHPCNALTLICRQPEKRRYTVPVHGQHRITMRYFNSPDDFRAAIEFRSKKRTPRAVSKAFEILAPPSK